MQSFRYGHHDAFILDNLVEWSLVLKYRALLQANVDVHVLGESATGIYSYPVFLWGIPVCITLDADVDTQPWYLCLLKSVLHFISSSRVIPWFIHLATKLLERKGVSQKSPCLVDVSCIVSGGTGQFWNS